MPSSSSSSSSSNNSSESSDSDDRSSSLQRFVPASSSDDDSSHHHQDESGGDVPAAKIRSSLNGIPRNLHSSGESSETDQSSTSEDGSNEASLPLAERIQRQDERGIVRNAKIADRKARALALASERLHQMRRDKASQTVKTSTREKKKSKHAPTEVSSKRSDFFQRQRQTTMNERGLGVDLGAHRYKPRDPRMDNMTGHFNVEHYERNYEFLNQVRQKEIAALQTRITAWKMKGRNGQRRRRQLGMTGSSLSSLEHDQMELKRLLQEKADQERAQIDRAAQRAVKQRLKQDGSKGVYFPKRRELKRMHMEARFDELRKRGGDQAVEKAVNKRRKKNKSRDSGRLGESSKM